MEAKFSIGELSKIFDIKISTLRYYDEIGLLTPEFVNPSTHYRSYSTQQFERLSTIKYLRALGMPLTAIQSFFANREVPILQKMLRQQQQTIREQQAALQIMADKIDQRLALIDLATQAQLQQVQQISLGNLVLQYLRRHFTATDDIEIPISALREQYGIGDDLFLGKVGLSLNKADFQTGHYVDYNSVFMLIEEPDQGSQIGPVTILPAGQYLQLFFRGSHVEAPQYYAQLSRYLKEHQLQINGDPLEITLIDYGVTNNTQQYVTEILLPIKS